jgi:hypothetical protein
MFRALLRCLEEGHSVSKSAVMGRVREGDPTAREVLTFMEGMPRFAFYDYLRERVARRGLSVEKLREQGDLTPVIRLLLEEEGLNYAHLPKGLIPFHEYRGHNRTALEEQLVEAAGHIADSTGRCRVHFTVSQEHEAQFKEFIEQVRPLYEREHRVSLEVTLSVQSGSTDTIAVDGNNRPFRDQDGRLVFRPGGHGALLENLNDLGGDVVFIKNIDNVVPDRLKSKTLRWKKILGGYLVWFQKRIFTHVQSLQSKPCERPLLDQAARFAREELGVPVPKFLDAESDEIRRAALLDFLNRPIRVCGMVRNQGEPGGGPFWVKDPSGRESIQIVERAQLDPDSQGQQEIFESATHFNPVDLVCGVRDVHGAPFDLFAFMDPDAIIIAKKSRGGADLKALEHPGLWNGAMARWITLLVEVPVATFNPVKTVNDLLRDAHQPG